MLLFPSSMAASSGGGVQAHASSSVGGPNPAQRRHQPGSKRHSRQQGCAHCTRAVSSIQEDSVGTAQGLASTSGRTSSSAAGPTRELQPSLPASPLVLIPTQRTHSLHAQGEDVIHSMANWAEQNLLRFLKPAYSNWQPQDLLPDASSPDFLDQVRTYLHG